MSKTLRYPLPITGVDMLSNETALVKGAVRSAVNVDLGRAGDYARRTGYTRVVALPGLHSLYYSAQRGITLVARDSQLYKIDPTSLVLTSLYPMRSTQPIEYTEYNGNLYFTNRQAIGWIPSNSPTPRAVGVPTPTTPTLMVSQGTLLPGTYGVVITLIDERGEEGGATLLQTIKLPAGGGIRLHNLPILSNHYVCVYITSADGDMLRRAEDVPAVFPAYTITTDAQGGVCDTQYLVPLPPGDMIRWHSGRLYTAINDTVCFSEPMRPHLYNPAHGFIQFSGWISFIEPVQDGIYVGDTRGVWFLSGQDPEKFAQRRVSTHRAVYRSSLNLPHEHFDPEVVRADSPVAMWLSSVGYVVGLNGGTVVELHPDRVRVPAGLRGRSTMLLREGRKQIITTVNSSTTAANGVATDSII
jgi:hypothetical protein